MPKARFGNLTLQRKVSILVMGGVAVGVLLFGVFGLLALNQTTDTTLQERLTLARVIAKYGDDILDGAVSQLEHGAGGLKYPFEVRDLDAMGERLRANYSLQGVAIDSLVLVDADFLLVWASPAPSQLGRTAFSDYESLRQSLREGKSVISGQVPAPASGQPVVLISTVVRDALGEIRGLLVAGINIAASSPAGFIQPIRLGETGYTEIVDQKGMVLVRTSPGNPLFPFEVSDHPQRFADLIAERKPTMGTCHTCHEIGDRMGRDVLAFVPLSKASWGVLVRQSEDEALASTRDLQRRLFASGMILMFLFLGIAWVITHDVVTRIRGLKLASQQMAGGDLTTAIPTAGKDEIGSLAEAFDNMRTKLKESYDEVEQRSKELSSLLAISKSLTSNPEFPSFLDAGLAKTVEIVPAAEAGGLLLYGREEKQYKLQSAVGLDNSVSPGTIFKAGGGGGNSAKEGEPAGLVIPKHIEPETSRLTVSGCDVFLGTNDLASRVKHSLCAPLTYKDRYVGVLIVMNFSEARTFTAADERLMEAIAKDMALAIVNTELSQEAERAMVLIEADKIKSQFISAISHELRTPLTSIKGGTTSLLRQDVDWDSATRREFLRTIDERADELQNLIDKMLQIAKLEAGALKLEREPLSLPRLAQRIVQEMAARTSVHRLETEFPAPFPIVEADSRCIEQVLKNLVENAIKYSPQGGKVRITGGIADGLVVVSVSDEGIGISPEHLEKVFDRFYRVESAHTQRIGGTGLGLSIARGLVEAHGGRIWAESTEGKGSVFRFSLSPLSKDEE
ncbi:MAG: HAMP domain-containing protein [Chloroflexi bacterium]|nr:HAMP domain-containing protein [Chloroflexota bacterium]